jgi:hypothetical protein
MLAPRILNDSGDQLNGKIKNLGEQLDSYLVEFKYMELSYIQIDGPFVEILYRIPQHFPIRVNY